MSKSHRTRTRNHSGTEVKSYAAAISDTAVSKQSNVVYQEFRVYIEGVQVPFTNFSVSQPYGQLPSATLSIPPASALTEIARNYFPKVHIFYKDIELDRQLREEKEDVADEDVFRVMFSGVIHRSSYSKRNSAQGAGVNLQFHCTHKNYVLDEVVLRFAGGGVERLSDPSNADTAGTSFAFTSEQTMLEALQGTKRRKPDTKNSIEDFARSENPGDLQKVDIAILPRYLDTDVYWDRIKGMPSVLVVMWNVLLRDVYANREMSQAMVEMYIPLVEQGIRFFSRMQGHSSLEEELQSNKQSLSKTTTEDRVKNTGTDVTEESVKEVLIPPIFKTFIGGALSADLSLTLMQSMMAYTGEASSVNQIFGKFLRTIRYDLVTLASPVQSVDYTVDASEVLVKPLLPFYFSPTCNVFLSNMYYSIEVQDSYYDTPTRCTATQYPAKTAGTREGFLEYRAPHYVRSSMAADQGKANADLSSTLKYFGSTYGAHENGRGIKAKPTMIEGWVQMLYNQQRVQADRATKEGKEAEVESGAEAMLEALKNQWNAQYPGETNLNPWEATSVNGIQAYERNLFSTLEYDYSLSQVEARNGRIEGPFNPYVVPGYPCDIMDPSSEDPSYHAFVVSVTHSVSAAGSCVTSTSFTSALTYDEMQTYNAPPVYPWVQAQLKLMDSASLLTATDEAKVAAADYYNEVLGVGYADPAALYDFERGRANFVVPNKANASIDAGYEPYEIPRGVSRGGYYPDPNMSIGGCLGIVRREIESMADIERHSRGLVLTEVADEGAIKFIHIEDRTGDSSTILSEDKGIPSPALGEESIEVQYADTQTVGKSLFLDYDDYLNYKVVQVPEKEEE